MARNRVAVFIELANISSAFDKLKRERGFPHSAKLDFIKLLSAVAAGSQVISKSVYLSTRKDLADDSGQNRFLDFFKKCGFNVIKKDVKVIYQGDGSRKNKGNFDVEITFDICNYILKHEHECDEIILMSGDSDFAYLIDKAKELNFKITVVSSRSALSRELDGRAERLILLDDLDLDYLKINTK